MRTAIYVRISPVTHSQQHSIEEQLERLHTHLLARGAGEPCGAEVCVAAERS